MQRQYWDHRPDGSIRDYNYVRWQNQRIWGLQTDLLLFNWQVGGPYGWQPYYWNWYCPDVGRDGLCYRGSSPWAWHWQWRAEAYNYDSAWQWYTDYTLGRYWLYRYQQEADQEAADAYWTAQLADRQPWMQLDEETQAAMHLEIDYAIREAHGSIYNQPNDLLFDSVHRRFHSFIADTDYSVYLADGSGEVCTLTRGSIIKLTALPNANAYINNAASAVVLHAHDFQDGADLCSPGTSVLVQPEDLVDMSNEFRSHIQDGLSAEDNGRSLNVILNLH